MARALDDRLSEPYGVRDKSWLSLSGRHPNRAQEKPPVSKLITMEAVANLRDTNVRTSCQKENSVTTSRLVTPHAAALLSAVVALRPPPILTILPAAEMLPTGQRITPEAATGAHFQDLDPGLAAYPAHRAGMAVSTIASHDGKTLLMELARCGLAERQSRLPRRRTNICSSSTSPTARHGKSRCCERPMNDGGIAFALNDAHFYVAGGVDDSLHIFARHDGVWSEDGASVKPDLRSWPRHRHQTQRGRSRGLRRRQQNRHRRPPQ